jgi:SAM-dependent methyltransferase
VADIGRTLKPGARRGEAATKEDTHMSTTPWFENERFWAVFAPVLFGEQRLAITPEQTDRLVDLLEIRPGATVLDLCCGPGRHSIELAHRGCRVTGVDRQSDYVARAQARAAAEGAQVEFVIEDMRRFVRPGAFDAVINMFTSFGYFEDPADDRLVLEHAFTSLKPGGRILLELVGREVLARVFRERDWSQEEDGSIFLQERRLAPDWGWIDNRWILIRDGRSEEFRFGHRLYTGTELAALLRACGFADAQVFGSLAGVPYDQQAGRLVVRARKP